MIVFILVLNKKKPPILSISIAKTRNDPQIFLEDIVESIDPIRSYTRDTTYEQFSNNRLEQDAIIRRIEIIGEAVKNLPMKVRQKYPKIPWKYIAGTRDILIHEYFRVNLMLAWRVATIEVPKLRHDILRIINEMKKEK